MLFRLGCIFFALICFDGFSNEYATEQYDDLISEIIANEDTCVQVYSDERIYLDPKNIFPTTNGLFLRLNENQSVALPLVYADSDGCYIYQFSRWSITRPCPFCGWQRISTAFKCPNPECPSNQKDKKTNSTAQ